jgi:hypothetical protein
VIFALDCRYKPIIRGSNEGSIQTAKSNLSEDKDGTTTKRSRPEEGTGLEDDPAGNSVLQRGTVAYYFLQ